MNRRGIQCKHCQLSDVPPLTACHAFRPAWPWRRTTQQHVRTTVWSSTSGPAQLPVYFISLTGSLYWHGDRSVKAWWVPSARALRAAPWSNGVARAFFPASFSIRTHCFLISYVILAIRAIFFVHGWMLLIIYNLQWDPAMKGRHRSTNAFVGIRVPVHGCFHPD